MINETIFDDIKQINGYLGSGLSQFTGELLLHDYINENLKLEETLVTFNDVFRNSHSLSQHLSLGKLEIMELTTTDSKILMACSGENSPIHLHLFAVFKKDGNVALAKLIMPRILNKAVKELT
jgi:predicted regulator of Ras-like GTPase activity (Roadblock/LC7/MglB family)